MTEKSSWQTLFRQEDHIHLALHLRGQGARSAQYSVRAAADDEVLLFGGASGAARRSKRSRPDRRLVSLVVTPEPGQSEQQFESLLIDLKEEYPSLELSGFSPESRPGCLRLFDAVAVRMGEAGLAFQTEPGWTERLPSSGGVILTLLYHPEVTPDALQGAAIRAAQVENLVSVVPLPLAAGDRIPLAGLTTAGTTDVMVISVLRYLLPRSVRVRASWAALGWKVAQLALHYGADELAGWSAAEAVSYSGRVRAAARVEREELLRGLAEAGRTHLPWWESAE